MLFLCARTALFVPQSNTQVFISACVHICMWLEVCTSPTVTSWHAPMSISKRWNENRSSNQCCRGLRAYRFPFHFPHSGKTKSDTWVNEQTTEVIWGNANVDFWHKSDPDYTSDECLCCVSVRTVCVCACQSCRRYGQASAGSYLCVTGKGTMQRIDAKPTATLQGYSAFYSPHSSRRQKILLWLPLRLSLSAHCILRSVLLFKCSYSPFRRRATFKPTVTMATPICIWKSAFEGANEMCNNMPQHCPSQVQQMWAYKTCEVVKGKGGEVEVEVLPQC